MKIRPVMLTALSAAVLLVAGCSSSTTKGSGSGGSAPASSSAGSPSSSSAGTSSGAAAPSTGTTAATDEKARIAGIPIQPGELPSAWKSTPVDQSTAAQDAASQAEIAKCIGGKDTSADRLAKVETDWASGNDQITSNAQAMRTEADVQADIASMKSPKAAPCNARTARKTIAASLPSGTTVKSLKLTITPGSGGGPSNVVAVGHALVTVLANGQTVPIYEDFYLIAGRRIEAEADFTGIGHQISPALQKQVVAAVAQRAAAA